MKITRILIFLLLQVLILNSCVVLPTTSLPKEELTFSTDITNLSETIAKLGEQIAKRKEDHKKLNFIINKEGLLT